MAGSRLVSNVFDIMRRVISRRNQNDPDSDNDMLMSYLNDFISLTMSDEVKAFEQFGTLKFTIDETNTSGVYTFNEVGAANNFVNISLEGIISILDPVDNSVSWNPLEIYFDPGTFYMFWGINNDEKLIKGFPTQMLYYGNEMVFRTIPEQSYQVRIYGYKQNNDFQTTEDDPNLSIGDQEIPFDYWLRYLAYGASLNYARDFNFGPDKIAMIQKGYNRERKLLLTRTHNERKLGRCYPRF